MDCRRIAVGVIAGAALAACSSPARLEVAGNQQLDEVCTPTGAVLQEGIFDLSIGDRFSYLMTARVQNRSASEVRLDSVHVEILEETTEGTVPIRIRCELGATCEEWDLDLCGGGTCPTVPANGTVTMELPTQPRLVTAFYNGQLETAVAEGRTPPEFRVTSLMRLQGSAGGMPVQSAPFELTTRLCLGCLVVFPEGTDSPSIPGPDCCGTGEPLPVCHPGQDDPLDCRRCVRSLPELCNFGRTSCAL